MFVPERAVTGGFRPATLPQREGMNQSPPTAGSFCELLYQLDGVVSASCGALGRCLATGQLAPVLKTASAAGFGQLTSELARAGVPRAEFYQRSISDGKILVSVHCNGLEETNRVQSVLVRAGAEDLLTAGATSSREPGPEPCPYPNAA